MSRDRWSRVRSLFENAAELPLEQRESFLLESGEDPAVLNEVRELLDADQEDLAVTRGVQERLALRATPETVSTQETAEVEEESSGARLGHYKLLRPLGEGGFGTVWMAEQEAPVQRRVALKVIKRGMDTKQVIARFEIERQALAMMDHPAIAKVFDAGMTERGRPFFVMEYVKGIPITDYCDQARLSTVERLALFRSVCEGLQHAHQKGIIHRDLKPANVLVESRDGEHAPKIIDFGIAKAVHQRLTEQTLYTEIGQLVGTPEYMAPEQADLSNLDIDTRADVYSLGVLLYELLTGTRPFDVKTLLEDGYDALVRHIREVDPPRPSTRISTLDADRDRVAKDRSAAPHSLGRMFKGDLDWIVMKALEKDRSRRYATAAAFSEDIERYLRDEPVIAGPPSRWYRARKYVRRHRGGVIAVGAVFVTLVIGFATTFAYYRRSDALAEKLAGALETATTSEARAVESARRFDRQARLSLSLTEQRFLEEKIEEVDALWPRRPRILPSMEAWMASTRELLEKRSEYESYLREISELFPSEVHRDWLRSNFEDILTAMDRLEGTAQTRGLVSEIEERMALVEEMKEGPYDEDWEDAAFMIEEDPVYRGLQIKPRWGWAPLDVDPETGFWEFWVWETGDRPVRDEKTGKWKITPTTGVVMVLLPGGRFHMGASPRVGSPNRDELAQAEEGPPVDIELAPFYLSKYEFTQGQWTRLMGSNPSQYDEQTMGSDFAGAHPVESISWDDAMGAARRLELTLPTEAQWEYAARGGTHTPWFCGSEKKALVAYANLADRAYARLGGSNPSEPWDDLWAASAPVGSLRPNDFGFFDVLGNVWEWCADPYGRSLFGARRDGDGLFQGEHRGDRVDRGGCFLDLSINARSSSRQSMNPAHRTSNLGVRFAAKVDGLD